MERNADLGDEMVTTTNEGISQYKDCDSWEEDAYPDTEEADSEEGDSSDNEEMSAEYEGEAEDDSLPELTEEEMFGEGQHDEFPAEPVPAKPKRASRKKKAEVSAVTAASDEDTEKKESDVDMREESGGMERETKNSVMGEELAPKTKVPEDRQASEGISGDTDSDSELLLDMADAEVTLENAVRIPIDVAECEGAAAVRRERSDTPATQSAPKAVSRTRKVAEAPVLTLEARGEVETEESRDDAIWHEIHNAYRTRRILTGQLGGIEQTDSGKTIAIVDYKGFRIVIPLKEMMIDVGRNPSGQEYVELMLRQNKILGNMLGAEIDFSVKGIDSKSRSVVASRREAMLKKRQIFYLDTDASGMYRIYEGRIVQARVIAVAEKVLRVEIFGVECSIMARDLAWDWIGDAHERFSVGDQVLVRVLSVRRDSLEEIAVKADIKSVSQNTSHDNLKKCRIQSKYAGKVTDVHKGVVYIRLSNGVNAVAHSCYDYRTPGKKDDVSFAVTRLDEERGVAVGIITRIIRQNL
nr:S1 RNA-binding domain-containing protein [uncultured Acetatifactor sp.]